MRASLAPFIIPIVLAGCTASVPSSPATSFGTCEDAFRAWIANAESLNSPGVDLEEQLVNGDRIQHSVFELCRLEEAERLNNEVLLREPSGTRPMIEPDIRTFAEVECVDESPQFDDTALCAEVGR